jgi:hypothetical protein
MGTSTFGFSPRLRDEQAKKDDFQQRQANPGVIEVGEYYFQKYKREQAERKAREAEAERKNAELKAEIAEEQRQRRIRERLTATYIAMMATSKEIELVEAAVRRSNPADFGSPEIHAERLLLIRSLLQA